MTQKGLKMKTKDTRFGINRNFLFGICEECGSNSQNLIKVHIVGYGLTQNDLGTPTISPRLVRYLTVYPENSDKAWNVECSHEEWVVFHRMTLPVQPSHLLPYGDKWKKARDKFMAEHKYCVYCERRGIKTTATVCDHIVPHKGDKSLFWNKDNWQALCNHCHNTIKAEEERRLGYR